MSYIGQEAIIGSFNHIIKNNLLSHAYTFTGVTGIGKKTMAHYLSKFILCSNRNDGHPCGNCRPCKSFDAGCNPNFMVIRNETQKILIKQIRALVEDISIRPASGNKVYLIEDADKMTPEAQNCLLKTLEEPPAYAVIFLTTSMFESLLATIRSRTVQIKLKPYNMSEMRRILESKGIEIKGKEYLLSFSQGIPGKAIKLIGDANFEKNRQMVLRFVFGKDSGLELNQYLSKEKESFTECLEIMESIYRDFLLSLYSVYDGLINSDKKDNIEEYVKNLTPIDLTRKIDQINEIRGALNRNMNYQLAVDILTLGA